MFNRFDTIPECHRQTIGITLTVSRCCSLTHALLRPILTY